MLCYNVQVVKNNSIEVIKRFNMKKLYRSKSDRKLSGVCGGIAAYFNIDSTLVRLAWALISFFSASIPGILIYIVCAFVIPDEPDAWDTTGNYYEEK